MVIRDGNLLAGFDDFVPKAVTKAMRSAVVAVPNSGGTFSVDLLMGTEYTPVVYRRNHRHRGLKTHVERAAVRCRLTIELSGARIFRASAPTIC